MKCFRDGCIMLACLFSFNVFAAIDTFQFKDGAQEQQYPPAYRSTALPEMPEQQHCGFQCHDCR